MNATRPAPPPWWVEVRRTGLDLAAAQRAQVSIEELHSEPAPARPLLDALAAVMTETGGAVHALSDAQQAAVVQHLTYAAIRTREGEIAAARFAVASDPEVRRAAALLGPP